MDIDIDSGNRDDILRLISHIPASICRDNKLVKHNTGVYVTDVPTDPLSGQCSLDHKEAELLGYIKLDLLNVNVYDLVSNREQLLKLQYTEPAWEKLSNRFFVEQVIHINRHFNTIQQLQEPINSVPRLAMFLAMIRPAKKHLLGRTWKEVSAEIWSTPNDNSYYYKKSHAVSYAYLTVVHMNLLTTR